MRAPPLPHRQAGVTLVELIVCMLILSVALSAVLGALATSVRSSGDPLVRRQNAAVAESLVQEIDAVPFHQKEPYSPGGANDAIGPEAGESRAGTALPFDNPNDYAGYVENGIVAPDGSAIAGLTSYSASVSATQQALGNVPASDGLLVIVTTTGPGGESISVASFRAMYAP